MLRTHFCQVRWLQGSPDLILTVPEIFVLPSTTYVPPALVPWGYSYGGAADLISSSHQWFSRFKVLNFNFISGSITWWQLTINFSSRLFMLWGYNKQNMKFNQVQEKNDTFNRCGIQKMSCCCWLLLLNSFMKNKKEMTWHILIWFTKVQVCPRLLRAGT